MSERRGSREEKVTAAEVVREAFLEEVGLVLGWAATLSEVEMR